ncbi:hypothetical protein L3X38_041343 [Prunus dulcis]|uniref:Retrovirus-related Pol polyprotein from transposon TNT 1-94-like beta-barrel domain-containing protein n=1 Tax=Prunus dulcis TaxID=3755 RepID=A0AAD4UST7_PRUDU|nr:hypothetical protein L3X38_041343 [Prunus dulcis]
MDSVETNNVKPGKFNGTNFKRWQRQLKYWLTVLGLVSALEDQTTPDKTTETTSKTKEKMTKEELEFHCHNRILSALSDDLYDVYQDTKNAKTLWDELEAEYGIEDAGIDCFTISNFNNYMMVENKTNSSGGSVTLGNDTVAQVRGIGEVELKMTSGKTLTLKDVRHVPEVRRNLISGSSLVKQGYKIVMESNRIVITRNDVFIGKGYVVMDCSK